MEQMIKNKIRKVSFCRICHSKRLITAFSLGLSPLANSFTRKQDLAKKDDFFPLGVVLCQSCGLLQLSHIVNPKILFSNYLYVSSTSKTFVDHFVAFAKEMRNKLKLKKNDLIVDIGSNDGILLRPYISYGCRVLGVDPAKNVAQLAEKSGVHTVVAFFNKSVATNIRNTHGQTSLICATNVFAHVDDLYELLEGVDILLKDNGTFVIEVPYLADMIKKNLFDTIYHEHLSYFAVRPLITLFKRVGMYIFDVQRIESHGGSIRVFAAKSSSARGVHNSISKLLALEADMHLESLKTYKEFYKKIHENKSDLIELLKELKDKKKIIVGFGAPAKGNTLLNYFNIGTNFLKFIVDDNPLKQNLFTPGTHIPIFSTDKLSQDAIDYILILAWNFAPSIQKKYSDFTKKGVRFIIPVPHPEIL